MTKGIAEIEAALRERYSGRTDTKNGMTYAAWEDITYAANDIFGPLGWNREFVVTPHEENGGYACVLRVTVTYLDEQGVLRSVSNEAPGYNEMSSSPNAVDTAFKGAYADAIKKVLQVFGDAFGLFIGAEAKAAKAAAKGGYKQERTTTTSAPRPQTQQSGGTDRRPSDKQAFHLKKAGYTDEMIATAPFNQWKGDLDDYFAAKDSKPVLAAVKTPASFTDDEDDDF
jgi:hypothetical protein